MLDQKYIRKRFYTAYLKGRRGYDESTRCPYRDLRTSYHNGVTFSAAYRRYWFEGFEDAQNGWADRYVNYEKVR